MSGVLRLSERRDELRDAGRSAPASTRWRRACPDGLASQARCGLLLLALASLPAAAAPVLSTNLPPISPVFPDAGLSVIRVLGALALVLGIFLGGVWLFRNWRRMAIQRGGHAPQLQVLETRALGHRHALYVVAYQQQRLLLAVSPAGVALVSHLPAVAAATEGAAEPPAENIASPNFLNALQQAVQRKA